MSISVIRFAKEHISAAVRIEKETFSEPWSEESLALFLREEYPSFAVCRDGELLAYVGTSRSLDELQILTVATAKSARRQGLGRELMKKLDEYAAENGIFSISLEVRESNAAAISLYESCGYKKAGVRKNFYRFPTENALVMIKNSDN